VQETTDDKIIGELIRARRVERRISQTALAEVIGVPQTIVSRIELGQRRLTVGELRLICDHLEASIVEFVAEYQERLRGGQGVEPGG